MSQLIRKANEFCSTCFDSVFQAQPQNKFRFLGWGWLIALYLVGLGAWGFFLDWGQIGFTFPDWVDVTAPRLTFLQDAVTKEILPLHTSDPGALGNVTTRYMAIPDAFLAPQAVFLRWMDIGPFILLDVLLMYSIGFIGLLLVKRRFHLSVIAFTPLFLLFNFNGDILAHIGIGHFTWGGYFLFPFFVLLVFRLFDGERGWGWIARMSILLFVILLQGSFHQFIWLLIFLTVLSITRREYFLSVIGSAVFSVLLSVVRLLPPALETGVFVNRFHGGYPDFLFMIRSLVEIKYPGTYLQFPVYYKPMGSWELDIYIGLLGALFVGYFGLFCWLKSHKEPTKEIVLILPMAFLTALSVGVIFEWFRMLPIPLLDGERVSSRIFSLPFVFLVILAAREFQLWLEKDHRLVTLIRSSSLVGLLVMGHDLWQNLKIWRISSQAAVFEADWFNIKLWFVNNHYDDIPYIDLLEIGALVSGVTLVGLGYMTWREARKKRKKAASERAAISSG
jgi:hypothetical protein